MRKVSLMNPAPSDSMPATGASNAKRAAMSRRSLSWQGAFCHPKIGKSPHFYKSRAQRVRGLRNLRREKRHLPRSRRGAGRAGAGRGGGTDCGSRVVECTAVRGLWNALRFGRPRHAGSFAVRGGPEFFAVRAGRMLRSPVRSGRTPRSRGRYSSGSNISLPTPHFGAGPVVGQLLERGAGCDAVVGIADRRVVNPVADGAFVLFHCLFFSGTCIAAARNVPLSVDGAYCVPECGCEGRFFLDYFA